MAFGGDDGAGGDEEIYARYCAGQRAAGIGSQVKHEALHGGIAAVVSRGFCQSGNGCG